MRCGAVENEATQIAELLTDIDAKLVRAAR
jgi:hypothetical protein